MAVHSNSPLLAVPKEWRNHLKEKPECEYKDVMMMGLEFWKINSLYRGYLTVKVKRKHLLQRGWTSRYAVISANLILLFKDCTQSTNKPLEYTTVSPDDIITVINKMDSKHMFCFSIKTAHRDDKDWVFNVPEAEKLQMWVAALEATIDFMKHGRIKKWSLKLLEKEKTYLRGPQTDNEEGGHRYEYAHETSDEENIYFEDDGDIDEDDDNEYELIKDDDRSSDLTDMELSILAGTFGSHWKSFAREKLLFVQSEIECIVEKNRYDLKEQMFDALIRWRKKQDGLHTRAKLIAMLKSSQYCDPDSWLCLESASCNGYVSWTKQYHNDDPSSPIYYNVTTGKQTVSPPSSRSLHGISTSLNQGCAIRPESSSGISRKPIPPPKPDKLTQNGPISDRQAFVKRPDQYKEVAIIADLKPTVKKQSPQSE